MSSKLIKMRNLTIGYKKIFSPVLSLALKSIIQHL